MFLSPDEMDSSPEMDDVNMEKATAMLRYSRLRKITKLLRLLEICIALVLLSWSSTRLKVAVEIWGFYLQQLCEQVVKPRFVFVIANAIVIVLFVNFGQVSGKYPEGDNVEAYLKEDIVKNSKDLQKIISTGDQPVTEDIAHKEKHIVCSEDEVPLTDQNSSSEVTHQAEKTKKCYRRTQSENLERQKPRPQLRRSATEKCRKVESTSGETRRRSYPLDDLNNEEFRCTIEAFIERQQKFLREEWISIVRQKNN